MRPSLKAVQSSQDGLRYLTSTASARLFRALLVAEEGASSGRRRRPPHQVLAKARARNQIGQADFVPDFLCPSWIETFPGPLRCQKVREVQSKVWGEPPRRCFDLGSCPRRPLIGPPRHLACSSGRLHPRRSASTSAQREDEEHRTVTSQPISSGSQRSAEARSPSETSKVSSRWAEDLEAEIGQRRTNPRPLEHWTAPLDTSSLPTKKVDADRAFARLLRALRDLQSVTTRYDHDLREKLSEAGRVVWEEYRSSCHLQRMPLSLRLQVGRALVQTMRRVKSRRQSYPKILSESTNHGHRLSALVRDCNFFEKLEQQRSRTQETDDVREYVTAPEDRHAIANFKVQSQALLGEEIMARKGFSSILEQLREPLIKSLESDSPLHDHMPAPAASDLFESMCAILDAMIARDQTARYRKLKDQGVSDPLDAAFQLAPLESAQDRRDSSQAPSRQSSLLDWLLKHPQAFALIQSKSSQTVGRRFSQFMSVVENPLELLDNAVGDGDWAGLGPSRASSHLMLAFAHSAAPATGFEIYRLATDRGARISEDAARSLLIATAWREEPSLTDSLIRLIAKNASRDSKRGWRTDRHLHPSTLATIALHRGRQANVERMEQTLAEMERNGCDDEYLQAISRAARLESVVARGDVQACAEEMAKSFDLGGDGAAETSSAKPPPDKKCFEYLLRSCNISNDVENALKYWKQMTEAGVLPDTLMFNSLFELLARGTDTESALQLLHSMRQWSVKPDKYTFTILVHLFALRKDTEGAIQAIHAMIAEGLRPDLVTWTALLNAYVETSSWDAAIGLFRWLQNNPDVSLRPNIATCNTLLKAYVLRAVPLQTVLSAVADIRALGLEWNAYTYALMLQSAIDAGMMDIAEEIFSRAEEQLYPPAGLKAGQGATLYHFTIMINGYLRQGNSVEAKEYFDELRDRGIEPSATTWATVISSYANSDSDDNFHLARTLVTQLVKDEAVKGTQRRKWKSPALRQGPPYENMFLPLILAHGRRAEPDEAEATADSLMETGSGLSLHTLTALLDSYRRSGEVERAVQLFDSLYEQVVSDTNIDLSRMFADPSQMKASRQKDDGKSDADFSLTTAHNVDPARRSLLCLPISIMIDLLSTTGLHAEVAKLWSRAKGDGFAFDSHNWNHLAAAMARAGKLDEALTVIERVLDQPVPDYTGRRWKYERSRYLREEPDLDDEELNEADQGSEGTPVRFSQEDDPLSREGLYPAHLFRGEDMTASPSAPPNRKHQNRTQDDPYAPLPFPSSEEGVDEASADDIEARDEDDTEGSATTRRPGRVPAGNATATDAEPASSDPTSLPSSRSSANFDGSSNGNGPGRSRQRRRDSAGKNLTGNLYKHRAYEMFMNPWYAHFNTLETVSEALDKLADSGSGRTVSRLLRKYRTAASILERHRQKTERIEEAKRAEAERSARDIIDRNV